MKTGVSPRYFVSYCSFISKTRSLVASDLHSETNASHCKLCAEVSSLQYSPCRCPSACEVGGSGREELKRYPNHCCPVSCEC